METVGEFSSNESGTCNAISKGLTNYQSQSLISKRYALLHIIFALSTKFQLNRMKTVGVIMKQKMGMDVQKDGRMEC